MVNSAEDKELKELEAELEAMPLEELEAMSNPQPVQRADRAQKAAFAKRLGELVHGRGIRQADLARKSGLAPYLVSNYMVGRAVPGRTNLVALAKALNVDPDSLLPAPKSDSDFFLDSSPMALFVDPNNPARATLRVNMNVRTEIGAEIVRLLIKDRDDLDKAG